MSTTLAQDRAPSPTGDPAESMDPRALDPAQKSLADALKITYRIIQLVMVVLLALFVLSGFETVGEGERGVSLTFGAIKQSDLRPGQQFHMPYPVGELVTVHTGSNEVRIDRAFYPGRRAVQPPVIRRQRQLKPGEDGSLLTGDGAVVHAQWSAVYSVREDGVSDYVQRFQPGDADRMVRAAVKRGAVRVVASLTVDEFLKQSVAENAFVGEAAIETRVRDVAQRTLDAVESGVAVERVTLDNRSPPGFVKEIFDEVSRQTSEAARAREDAQRYAREQLNAVAGAAAQDLVDLIDEFERHTNAGDDAAAERALARIDAILAGEPIEVPGAPARIVSGEVTQVISQAERYRTDVVTRAQAAADRFTAKLALYRDNPAVFVSTEWTAAYERFLERSEAQVFAMPPGASAEILINRDPDIARDAESERNAEQAEETLDQRMETILNRDRSQDQQN